MEGLQILEGAFFAIGNETHLFPLLRERKWKANVLTTKLPFRKKAFRGKVAVWTGQSLPARFGK